MNYNQQVELGVMLWVDNGTILRKPASYFKACMVLHHTNMHLGQHSDLPCRHVGSNGVPSCRHIRLCIGQIPRNGLTWGPVRNSGHIITLFLKIFIIDAIYSVI